MQLSRIEPFAIARYALAVVFIAFGIMQLLSPEQWYGYLPSFTSSIGLSDATLILLNGLLDLAIGILLAAGIFTRIVAIIATAHLAGIILTLGFNDVAVRDAGLLILAAAIALNGPDRWCLRKASWG